MENYIRFPRFIFLISLCCYCCAPPPSLTADPNPRNKKKIMGVIYLGACQYIWTSFQVSSMCGKHIKLRGFCIKRLNMLIQFSLTSENRLKYTVVDTHCCSKSSQMCSHCRKTADMKPQLSCVVAG